MSSASRQARLALTVVCYRNQLSFFMLRVGNRMYVTEMCSVKRDCNTRLFDGGATIPEMGHRLAPISIRRSWHWREDTAVVNAAAGTCIECSSKLWRELRLSLDLLLPMFQSSSPLVKQSFNSA